MTLAIAGPPRLRVSEVFGPTLQGEGPSLGMSCSFVRLGGCNLRCSWCDTPYAWDWTGRNGHAFDPRAELTAMSADTIWADLQRRGAPMLVVSGGEPLLQQGTALLELLHSVRAGGQRIEIETAGTISPRPELLSLVDRFNVSLKLRHSGNDVARSYRPEAIDALARSGKAIWKFVVRETADLDEVSELVRRHDLEPVWIMPEGTTAVEITARSRRLVGPVVERGWSLTTRLHILLYGDRRGV